MLNAQLCGVVSSILWCRWSTEHRSDPNCLMIVCLHSVYVEADPNKDEKQSRSVCDTGGIALDRERSRFASHMNLNCDRPLPSLSIGYRCFRSLANNSMSTVNIGGQAVGMRLVSCEAFESDKVTSLGSNAFSNDNHLQTVKVRVRYQRFADIEAIERWLESETRPTDLSERCRTLKGQIRSAKWRLDSLEHTQRVLFEDQRRRAEQVALQDHVKQATIKLVGFQRSSQRRTSEQEVIDKLAFQIQDERKHDHATLERMGPRNCGIQWLFTVLRRAQVVPRC